ncbi:male-specific lethal 1-like 1 [Culicoides brevitarsis]|uniref:male-specific lethal 1-like 1 n=1 Tax=Culicoides brevitarsis TaxID=469753 RepID=UPI00307BE333
MQQKSVNNAAMESKAYNALKQIEKTSALYADHIYCNQPQLLENENSKKQESVNSLKSMLILHLEVVKEQADQLLCKDKLIAKLKQENEELKARLEKYEQQQRHHHHHHRSSQQHQQQQQTKRISTTTKNPQTRTTAVTNDESETNKRSSDTILSAATTTITSPTPKRRKIERKPIEKSISSSLATSTEATPPVNPVSEAEKLPQETPVAETTTTTTENAPKKGPRTSFITTAADYILCDWQKSEAELDADAEPHVRATLEIPSWQVLERSFQNTFPPEQTEDMSDDAFLKRHTKFEIDERRRKKWDVQRLREQKQVERLKKRYQKDEYDERDQKAEHKSITSFYPSPENIMFIQIVDELPVLAFGDPIPALPESDFTLTWLTNTDPRINPSFTKTRFFSKKK